ncbi:MAG: hypothetical protein WD184_02950 [Acidimicrobiia bacterium]
MNSNGIKILAAVLAVAGASFVTVRATAAAFSDQTDSAANQFAAGTVQLSDNDAGSALFDGSSLFVPGDSVVGCIEVTYSGSVDAGVRLFGATTGGDGLEAYLDVTIERGTGDCTTFGTATEVWGATDGDLAEFLAAAFSYASGVDSWAPVGGGADDTVPYRITVTQQDDNAAQGLSSMVSFTWEAQSS